MASNPFKKLFGRKSVVKIGSYEEATRDAIQKAYIPKFLFKPPFGYPRFTNLGYIRHLAKTPYVDMAIQTIIDEVSSVDWSIVPCQGMEDVANEGEMEHIKNFFINPNTNRETFEQVFIEMPIRDMLEVNAGILNKVFNRKGDLVEVVARDGCLPYNSYIDTDRGVLRIGEIVKNKLEVNVKSVNLETGEIEYKPVVNWFRNGATSEWLKLHTLSNTKHRKLTCTSNHKIWTKEGYKLAGDLKIGDVLYTEKSKLSKDERQLILGSILGDASINDRQRTSFSETHSIKQQDYLLYKKDSLERFNPVYYEHFSRYDESRPETLKCRFRTEANLVFNEFKDLKHPEFKKEIFDELDLRGLAIWIQDDGYYYPYGSIEISTHRFEKETLEYAQKQLEERFGFESKIRRDNRFEDSWILYFDKKNTDKIIEQIKGYIHPSMSYKVGLNSEQVGQDITIEEGTGTEIYEVTLDKIERVERYDSKYDIEVEGNHNYFAHGKLISNSTFTKNPDIHGMYTNREDIIEPSRIVNNSTGQELTNPYTMMTPEAAREQAAYFQYGWITGPIPVPFGRREIIWLEKKKRTDEHYGESPVQILAEALQMLVYMVESDLEYYNDNNVPKGIIGLEDSDAEEVEAFKQQWNERQVEKDEFGNYKKKMHKVPIMNAKPAFERIEFSSSEMQVIEKQKWYTKMVWAAMGVTPVELGYTEDAAGAANQIVQSKVFRKKAVNPILRILENAFNMHLVSEFEYTVKQDGITKPKYEFKFQTFDVEDESKKYELYKLQTENGLKTVNEIRTEEGLEEVEWGDKPPKDWQGGGNNFNFGPEGQGTGQSGGGDYNNLEEGAEAQGSDDRADTKSSQVDSKPGMGRSEKWWEVYHALRREGYSEESAAKIASSRVDGDKSESKASVGSGSPLVPTEGEQPSPQSLEKSFKKQLQELERKLKNLIESEAGPGVLGQVKGLNDIVSRLKDLVSFEALRELTGKVIKASYLDGWDGVEKELDRNFVPDKEAIDYITKYTFDNIKGVEDELEEDLRQTLQRGFMDGEGVDRLKKRVGEAIDVHSNRAEMIARTETNRASNFGRLHGYQKAGVSAKKVYNAHLDDRTSPLCKRLNGQEVDLNDTFKDPKGEWEGKAPPAHPMCRSAFDVVPE